jgi:hypothetical protein
MPKIIHAQSGPQPPDPDTRPAVSPPNKVEIVITPEPKTTAQRRANAKAKRLGTAYERQEQNTYAPRKLSKWQKKAQRKGIRDAHYRAVQSDLQRGAISAEHAKELLPKRQSRATNDT